MKLVATIFSHSIRAHANHLSTIQSQDLSIHLHRPLPFSLLHTKIQILGQGIPPVRFHRSSGNKSFGRDELFNCLRNFHKLAALEALNFARDAATLST